MMVKASLIPAVGYIRMSSDAQEDSPDRQRAEIKALAKRLGYIIIRWYEDHGLTGTESANRPEFQKLLADAGSGEFEAVLLYEQSRFSREDIFDVMIHWRLLRDAEVKLVTCQRGVMSFGDLGGLITAIVDQHGARDESLKIAERTVSGKIHAVRQGRRASGTPIFGFDKEIRDESGQIVKRIHFRDSFRKPDSWSSKIVPSAEVGIVESIQWAFESMQKANTSMSAIARELNNRGITSVKGNPFDSQSVQDMLTNPVYAGVLRAGYYSNGKFRRMDTDGVLIVEDAHPAIVSKRVFDDVQSVITNRCFTATRKGQYLLRGLVFCAQCGNKVSGAMGKTGSGREWRCYRCNKLRDGSNRDCTNAYIGADRLEAFILSLMRDHILSDENRDRLMEAAQSQNDDDKPPPPEMDQLEQLRLNIERGTENLALAKADDFVAISSLLSKWRSEERNLRKQIKTTRPKKMDSEFIEALEELAVVRDNLHLAEKGKLSIMIHNSIKRITYGRKTETHNGHDHRAWFGAVEFHSDVYTGGPIPIEDDDVAPDYLWRRLCEYVTDEPITPRKLRKIMGLHRSNIHRALHIAEQKGRVVNLGSREGWVARTHNA